MQNKISLLSGKSSSIVGQSNNFVGGGSKFEGCGGAGRAKSIYNLQKPGWS